jgi:hypothetical protein
MKQNPPLVMYMTTILVVVSAVQGYQLKSSVIANGGTGMYSDSFISDGTFAQSTASCPWLTSGSYQAVIGFWKPSFDLSVHERRSPYPRISFKTALFQNYPNPVTGNTTINYAIAQKGRVSIRVYNIVGQYVLTLLEDYQIPGVYRIVWNTAGDSKIADGVYFYCMETDSYFQIKKMVITR